jgi:molybdate transport system ATP-binding protein
MAQVSPQVQRHIAVQESAFYQSRWHSGVAHGQRTVAEFLAQESVEDRNPFEIGASRGNGRGFTRFRQQLIRQLGSKSLWNKKLVQLSNGEMRKTLLIHELLKYPGLTILEDVYAGLDAVTRNRLSRVVGQLMRSGWPILVVTNRAEEIPAQTTHLLVVGDYGVMAQGPKRQMLQIWRRRFGANQIPRGSVADFSATKLTAKTGAPGQPIVELRDVSVTGARQMILRNITWTVREGESWVILGPNGAGKTTLLNLIQGDHPQACSAQVRLFGERSDSTQTLWHARQRIGWMSPELHQHYPPGWSAEDVVCSGFFNSIGLYESCSQRRRALARKWLGALGLRDQARAAFDDLSFGQQRLVLLARAIVKRPRWLILDEACQGLDAEQRRALLRAVDRTVDETGVSLIFVTHHESEVPRCISWRLRLAAGRVKDEGPIA